MKINKGGKWALLISLLIATIIAAMLYAPRSVAEIKKTGSTAILATSTVAEPAKIEPQSPALPKVLLDIRWCESKDNQSKIGYNYRHKIVTDPDTGATSTVKYLWSRDIGLFQINEYYHAAHAKSLGIDIYMPEGNTAYALLLYNKNGTSDWQASAGCWKNIDAAKAKNQSYY